MVVQRAMPGTAVQCMGWDTAQLYVNHLLHACPQGASYVTDVTRAFGYSTTASDGKHALVIQAVTLSFDAMPIVSSAAAVH